MEVAKGDWIQNIFVVKEDTKIWGLKNWLKGCAIYWDEEY